MIRGLYTAASGMIVENKRQENIAQNISNIQTPGFKQTFLATTAAERGDVVNNRNPIGSLAMRVEVLESTIQLTQGPLQPTDNSLDFAIQGAGFFTVQGANGEILHTRDGRFTIDEEGRLTTKEGFPVVVTNGEGVLQQVLVNEDMRVNRDGSFTINGQTFQFAIANLEDPNLMVQQGNGLYVYNGALEFMDQGFEVNQSMIEGSNVDALDALVDMIATNRALQTNSRVLTALDETLKLAATEIGRLT